MNDRPLALVTGAGSGIGRAAAIALAPDHDVGLVGRDPATLAETANLVAAAGGNATPLPLDVADESAVIEMYSRLVEPNRTLRTIVASAGVQLMAEDRPVAELESDVWHRTIATNLTGMFLTF